MSGGLTFALREQASYRKRLGELLWIAVWRGKSLRKVLSTGQWMLLSMCKLIGEQLKACERLKGVVRNGVYTMPDGPKEYDVILPASRYNVVAMILGLPVRSRLRLRKERNTPIRAQ